MYTTYKYNLIFRENLRNGKKIKWNRKVKKKVEMNEG